VVSPPAPPAGTSGPTAHPARPARFARPRRRRRTIVGGMARPSEASGEAVAGGEPKGGANPFRVPISVAW
jgi:hypothetical protein